MTPELTTLCYIEKDEKYLMLEYDFDMITDSGIKIYSKKNSNLMKKFLEAQEKQKKK